MLVNITSFVVTLHLVSGVGSLQLWKKIPKQFKQEAYGHDAATTCRAEAAVCRIYYPVARIDAWKQDERWEIIEK